MYKCALLATGALAFTAPTAPRRSARLSASFHDFEERLLSPAPGVDGEVVSFQDYKGQVVLVQNVASI